MLYAIKLGPIETGEGRVNAYVGFTETCALPPILSRRDEEGLEQLAQQALGRELRCERSLARVGKPPSGLRCPARPAPRAIRVPGRSARDRHPRLRAARDVRIVSVVVGAVVPVAGGRSVVIRLEVRHQGREAETTAHEAMVLEPVVSEAMVPEPTVPEAMPLGAVLPFNDAITT